MAILSGILKDSWAHYKNLEGKIGKRLKALPGGSVFDRSIGNQKYYYLSIRKNGSSQSRYLGKVRPKEMEEAIRERRRRTGLRLLHLSRSDDIDGRVEALRLGFDDAVAETVDPVELLGRIRLLDDRARARPDAVVVVADGVTVDMAAYAVRRDGALVHLRPKEFQLLAMLAAHPGRAYTRRQLLDRVWGPDHAGDPRTVDVHIRWLRSKIETRPDRPAHLLTVRGVGYRLDPDPR